MKRARRFYDPLFYVVLALTVAVFLLDIHLVFSGVLPARTMDFGWRIIFVHDPSACAMYLAAGACFIGSAAYFLSPTDERELFAKVGGESAVAFGLVAVVTGSIWIANAWARGWIKEQELWFDLWLHPEVVVRPFFSTAVYVVYLIFRSLAGDSPPWKRLAAALGVLGAGALIAIHFFSRGPWHTDYPSPIPVPFSVRLTYGVSFVAFVLLLAVLVWTRTRVEIAHAKVHRLDRLAPPRGTP
jgi:heme exporter protein C